jgi:hypothetical protein
LPTTTTNYEAKTVESGGWANLYGANPLTESGEAELISCLNGELNGKFATCLDKDPVIDCLAGSPDSPKRFVIVGSSHANRLSAELKKLGHAVLEVTRPGWRAMPGVVASLKEQLESRVAESVSARHNDVYVFQLWDNSLHAAWAEESATIPHTKDSLGKYHVHGDAIIVPAAAQTEIFKLVLPLLTVAKRHSTVLLGPLPRYLYSACCRDSEHVTNLRKDDYRAKMRADCDAAIQKLRDSAWFCGLEKAKAINPGRSIREHCDMKGADERLLWGEDPVHLSQEAYRAIAEDVVKAAATTGKREQQTW